MEMSARPPMLGLTLSALFLEKRAEASMAMSRSERLLDEDDDDGGIRIEA